MRLDARKGDSGWQCFDVGRAAIVPDVVFIDEESASWGSFDNSPWGLLACFSGGSLPVLTHHEKSVRVVADRRMVLFNAIDDSEPAETVCEGVPMLRDIFVPRLPGVIDPKQREAA